MLEGLFLGNIAVPPSSHPPLHGEGGGDLLLSPRGRARLPAHAGPGTFDCCYQAAPTSVPAPKRQRCYRAPQGLLTADVGTNIVRLALPCTADQPQQFPVHIANSSPSSSQRQYPVPSRTTESSNPKADRRRQLKIPSPLVQIDRSTPLSTLST